MLETLHQHDVTVFWNFWPFDRILWTFFRNFINGFGFNGFNNWLNDLFFIPRTIWNTIFSILGLPLNILFDILNFIPNFLLGLPNTIGTILSIPPTILRYLPWWLPVFIFETIFYLFLVFIGLFFGVIFGGGIALVVAVPATLVWLVVDAILQLMQGPEGLPWNV